MELSSIARRDATSSIVSRNLHKYIHKKGKTLEVPITSVIIPVKMKVSRQKAVTNKPWPVLHLSSWMKTCLENEEFGGKFLLGGNNMDNLDKAEAMLSRFWAKYEKVQGDMPRVPHRTVPYLLHGDEGRGQVKRPLLIISFQGLIGWTGEDRVNSVKTLGGEKNMFFKI